MKLICVGKIKEKFYVEAIYEYLKRLDKYTKLEIIQIDDESNMNIALKKEGEIILNHIKPKDYVITLDIEGKMFSSLDFAYKVNDILNYNSNIVFVIGGSYGLDEKVKERSNLAVSFSKMTFPHQLFRVIFLEQLYRGFKIINNESYHK